MIKIKKLINIARPIQLPPLEIVDNTAKIDEQKKKGTLPLFGKKNTFGFNKQKPAVTQISKEIHEEKQLVKENESIEEFDDDDIEKDNDNHKNVTESSTKINDLDKIKAMSTESPKSNIGIDVQTDLSITLDSQKAHLSSDHSITEKVENLSDTIELKTEMSITKDTVNDNNLHLNTTNSNLTRNKSRNRKRNRSSAAHNQGNNIDEDTSPDKFAAWLPPENQAGDGITNLNAKYGY